MVHLICYSMISRPVCEHRKELPAHPACRRKLKNTTLPTLHACQTACFAVADRDLLGVPLIRSCRKYILYLHFLLEKGSLGSAAGASS